MSEAVEPWELRVDVPAPLAAATSAIVGALVRQRNGEIGQAPDLADVLGATLSAGSLAMLREAVERAQARHPVPAGWSRRAWREAFGEAVQAYRQGGRA